MYEIHELVIFLIHRGILSICRMEETLASLQFQGIVMGLVEMLYKNLTIEPNICYYVASFHIGRVGEILGES